MTPSTAAGSTNYADASCRSVDAQKKVGVLSGLFGCPLRNSFRKKTQTSRRTSRLKERFNPTAISTLTHNQPLPSVYLYFFLVCLYFYGDTVHCLHSVTCFVVVVVLLCACVLFLI